MKRTKAKGIPVIVYEPNLDENEFYHYEFISRGAEDNPEKVQRFNKEVEYMLATWQTNTKSDPYCSPNLTLAREDFSYNA